jgi:hypothetical protein
MPDARHHHVILVPVPYPVLVETPAAGSPESIRQTKPGKYPHRPREAWRPARAIPAPRNKAERFIRFLDRWARQDQIVREMLKPDAASLKAWLSRGGVLA